VEKTAKEFQRQELKDDAIFHDFSKQNVKI
jgi:hypothetical protein